MKRLLCVLVLCGAVNHATAGEGVVKLGGLSSKAPASWKQEEPANKKMRSHQFKLPKATGDTEDAELVVFFFGKEGGGSADENIKRWKGMMLAPEGKTIDDVSRVEKFKVGPVNVTYLDVSGTYLAKSPADPTGKTEKKSNYRRFGVIMEWPDGPYYITLTGPAQTVELHKKGFDEWVKNFK